MMNRDDEQMSMSRDKHIEEISDVDVIDEMM